MQITNDQMLQWATHFDLPGGVSIIKTHLAFEEGTWWIKNEDGSRFLTRAGWRLPHEISDGSLLFRSAKSAAEFFLTFDLSEPGMPQSWKEPEHGESH